STLVPAASAAKQATIGSVLESASMEQPRYWTLSPLLRAEPIEPKASRSAKLITTGSSSLSPANDRLEIDIIPKSTSGFIFFISEAAPGQRLRLSQHSRFAYC